MTPIRVVIAKVGLDGHDRGAKAVAVALQRAGFEVIYTGLRQTPEAAVATALQEDAAVIGVSLLSGAHREAMRRICALLEERGAKEEVAVMVGGNIPERDHADLRALGVDGIFPTGSRFDEIADWIRRTVAERAGGGVR